MFIGREIEGVGSQIIEIRTQPSIGSSLTVFRYSLEK